jgi:hypothetical protein
MSEIQKSSSEVDQELALEAQQHLINLEALVRFRELHPEIFEAIAPKVKAILTEGDNPIVPVLSEEEIKKQILTKPRKNKYGLVMDPLEQELENIKLELREIEKFDPRNEKGETSYEFFMRVYGEYRDANIIYQADLFIIDNKLLTNLKTYYRREKNIEYQIATLQELIPSRSVRAVEVINKIKSGDLSLECMTPLASRLFDKHK